MHKDENAATMHILNATTRTGQRKKRMVQGTATRIYDGGGMARRRTQRQERSPAGARGRDEGVTGGLQAGDSKRM